MKLEPVPNIIPKPGPSSSESGGAVHVWEALVPRLLSPVKLAIIEALLRVGEPMSATGLAAMFEEPAYNGGKISHHLRGMAEAGVLVLAGRRSVRGATELFFYFPPAKKGGDCSPAGAGATR